jgi:serine/threonine protein kinase
VFLVQNTETQDYCAAKVYDKGYLFRTSIGDIEQPIQKLLREVQIMTAIQHPNCLQLIEILDDDFTNSIVLILPFADSGGLSAFSWKSDKISEEEARFQFAQIARGIRYIHSLNIIHRDIKPDNILKFSNGQVVLADFSVSIFLDNENELLEDTDGTPAFYSPEECCGDPYLGKPTDCWAFGMMLYVMIYGKLPFFDGDDEGVFFSQFFKISQMIMHEEFEYPESIPVSSELRDLLSHLLDKNPLTRYTMNQVLEHPWLKDVPDPFPMPQNEEEDGSVHGDCVQ